VLGVIGVLGTGMIGAMVFGPGERWRTDVAILLVSRLTWLSVGLVAPSIPATAEGPLPEERMEALAKEGETE